MPRPVDGLGTVMTFANPAAGQGWSVTVPAGKRWRLWGGSCRYISSSAAGSRLPTLRYEDGTGRLYWMESQNHGAQALSNYIIGYYEGEVNLTDLYVNTYLPVALKAIWLPAGTKIIGGFSNMDAGDQISQVGLLVEEISV